MIDCWRILNALREYYSPAGTDEELIPLCTSAAKEISARVKKNADITDIRLINAAAAIVNYRLCMRNLSVADSVTSFKAGDVTVSISPNAAAERAEKEKSEAMLAALPLLRDDEFVFRQVSV